MKKAVLFDLDGTLANTITSIAHCANQALNRFGFPSFTEEEYKLFVGNGADVLIRRALAAAGDREMVHFDEAYEEYRRLFREGCMYQVRPYEGIVPLLERLKESGAKIAVLSNKPHENSVYVVESLFGKGYFDCVCGRKENVLPKPDPAGVFAVLKELGLSPEECLYVGDSGVDMQTGKAAGLFTIGVLWGFRGRQELEENHADAVIETPEMLLHYME